MPTILNPPPERDQQAVGAEIGATKTYKNRRFNKRRFLVAPINVSLIELGGKRNDLGAN